MKNYKQDILDYIVGRILANNGTAFQSCNIFNKSKLHELQNLIGKLTPQLIFIRVESEKSTL